jgi:hypothetical protein
MARSKHTFRPQRSKKSGVKTQKRINDNNQILKKIAKELNESLKNK